MTPRQAIGLKGLLAALCVGGVLLHVQGLNLLHAAFDRTDRWLLLWSCSPYLLAAVAGCTRLWQFALVFVVLALLGDAYAHYTAFIAPPGPYATAILIFMPFYLLAVVAPGCLVLAVAVRWWRRRRARDAAAVQER